MITSMPRSNLNAASTFVFRRRSTAGVAFFNADSADTDWRSPSEDPDEPSDLDDPIHSAPDDNRWDVFLPDDDPYEPRPEPGDFWIDAEEE
jgi:hypothetical protein